MRAIDHACLSLLAPFAHFPSSARRAPTARLSVYKRRDAPCSLAPQLSRQATADDYKAVQSYRLWKASTVPAKRNWRPACYPAQQGRRRRDRNPRPLSCSKKRLRQDAHLLDRVPVAEVRMVETDQVEQCVSHKIFLGTLKVGGSTRSAWAFLSKELYREQDGVPRMIVFAGPEGGPLVQCKAELMDDDKVGRWTKVLKDISSLPRRTVFIKVGS
jgi:hypothetical protein